MDVHKNEDHKELYTFEYTWIIKNVKRTIEQEESKEPAVKRFKISSTQFKSHNENYEWLSMLIILVKPRTDVYGNPAALWEFYMEISCKNLRNNFYVFHQKKIEIQMGNKNVSNGNFFNVHCCVNSSDNRTSIYLFTTSLNNRPAGIVNYQGDLTIVFKITEPLSVASNTREMQILSYDYENLLKSGNHSDFKIITGEREFFVHKIILSARSEYFAAMCKYDTKEQACGMVEISGVHPEVINAVLQYIYCAKVIESDISYDLLTAADMYQINDLKKKCEKSIINRLKTSNVGECIIYAERYNNECLKEGVVNFLMKHASEFGEDDIKLLQSNLTSISSPFIINIICKMLLLKKNI